VEAKMRGNDIMEDSVKEISIKDISRKLEEFAQARDWEKYHSPRNLLLAMVNFLFRHCFSFSLCMSLCA